MKFPTAVIIVVLFSLLSINTSNSVFRVDDWDYISELHTLSFLEFLVKPNPAGQLTPVFKSIFGAFHLLFDYQNFTLGIFNYLVGIGTLVIWLLILRHLELLTLPAVLLLCVVRLSYVGLMDVFLSPQQGGLELSFFLTVLAAYLVIVRDAVKWAALCLFLGTFCWANGMVMCAVFPVVYLICTRDWKRFLTLSASWMSILIFLLTSRPAEGGEAGLTDIVKYFAASSVVHGVLSGIAPNTLRGIFHALFFILLTAGAGWTFWRSDSNRRFLIALCWAGAIALNLAVSVTRAAHGLAHAGSYRYVFMTLFLQLLLLSLMEVRIYLPVILLMVAVPFGVKARYELAELERTRKECLERVMAGDSECLPVIYHRDDPEFIRTTYKRLD